MEGLVYGAGDVSDLTEGVVLVGGSHGGVAVQERGDVALAVIDIGIMRAALVQMQQPADPPRQTQAPGVLVDHVIGPVPFQQYIKVTWDIAEVPAFAVVHHINDIDIFTPPTFLKTSLLY